MSVDRLTPTQSLAIGSPRIAILADEVRGRRLLLALARGGLGGGCQVTPSAGAAEALRAAATDLVIVRCDDARSAELAALLAIPELHGVRVLLVLPEARAADVRAAFAAGVDGIVLETALESTLAPSVWAVAAGQLVVPPVGRPHLAVPVLTSREKQVLALVVLGFSNPEIALKLHVAETTVKTHLSSSFRKLGVRSRSEACARISNPQTGLGFGILSITEPELDPVEAAT